MLAKEHRFHNVASFRFIFARGKTVRGQYFILRYATNRRRSSFRAAVIVSRKVHKSAVVRNRIRRRMYELIRQQASHFNEAVDLVFIVHSDAVAVMPSAKLQHELNKQLKKANLIA